jgi:lysophospholipase L1-like esterase
MRKVASNLALLAGSLIPALILAEVALRIGGFSFRLAPESVEFGWPDPVTRQNLYREDPDLFWVPKRYHESVARLAGKRLHIAFLGDSCTQFGLYTRRFVDLVSAEHPGVEIAAGVFGAGGWSTYQGLKLLRRDVVPLNPRAVTIYFGWNDHWVGFGVEDAEIDGLREGWLAGWSEARLAQLLFKTRLAYRSRQRGERPLRVPPEAFRRNLREMVGLARANGIVPVLLTAPTSHRRGHEPARLTQRWLVDLDELVPLHQRYVAIVREVAESEGAQLCDLARRFEALPAQDLRQRYFKKDGIHPRTAGDRKIAEFLFECFEREPELQYLWTPFSAGPPLRSSPGARAASRPPPPGPGSRPARRS